MATLSALAQEPVEGEGVGRKQGLTGLLLSSLSLEIRACISFL